MRNKPWRDETRSEAERADWDKARYEGAEPYIGKLEAEIARLTARCVAMERAIRGAVPLERMIHVTKPCAGCKHHDTNIPVGECALPTGYYDCVGHPDYPETHCQYEFDEARFAAKGGKPCC